eukprot:gene23482-33194_t
MPGDRTAEALLPASICSVVERCEHDDPGSGECGHYLFVDRIADKLNSEFEGAEVPSGSGAGGAATTKSIVAAFPEKGEQLAPRKRKQWDNSQKPRKLKTGFDGLKLRTAVAGGGGGAPLAAGAMPAADGAAAAGGAEDAVAADGAARAGGTACCAAPAAADGGALLAAAGVDAAVSGAAADGAGAAAGASPALIAGINKMKAPELRRFCGRERLPTTGSVVELRERWKEWHHAAARAADARDAAAAGAAGGAAAPLPAAAVDAGGEQRDPPAHGAGSGQRLGITGDTAAAEEGKGAEGGAAAPREAAAAACDELAALRTRALWEVVSLRKANGALRGDVAAARAEVERCRRLVPGVDGHSIPELDLLCGLQRRDLALAGWHSDARGAVLREEMAVLADLSHPIYEHMKWVSPETHFRLRQGPQPDGTCIKPLIHQVCGGNRETPVYFNKYIHAVNRAIEFIDSYKSSPTALVAKDARALDPGQKERFRMGGGLEMGALPNIFTKHHMESMTPECSVTLSQWWEATPWPTLREVALSVLSTPVSTFDLERSFSDLKGCRDEKQQQLTLEHTVERRAEAAAAAGGACPCPTPAFSAFTGWIGFALVF